MAEPPDEPTQLAPVTPVSKASPSGKTLQHQTCEAAGVPPGEQEQDGISETGLPSGQAVGEEDQVTAAPPSEREDLTTQLAMAPACTVDKNKLEGGDQMATKWPAKSASETAVTTAVPPLDDQQKVETASEPIPSSENTTSPPSSDQPSEHSSHQCTKDQVSPEPSAGTSSVSSGKARDDVVNVSMGKPTETHPTSKAKPEELPAVDWDYTTAMPVMQFNFILETALPMKQVASYNAERLEQLDSEIKETFGSSSMYEGVLAGNAALGFHLPNFQAAPREEGSEGKKHQIIHDDYDILLVLKDGLVCTSMKDAVTGTVECPVVAVTEKDEDYPGYVKLRVAKDHTIEPSCVVTRVGTGCPIFAVSKDGTGHISHAAMLRNLKEKHPDVNMSRVLIAFRCTSWPDEAKGWATRKRKAGWPEEDVVKAATDTPCYVVGEAHERCAWKEIQWRFCYPEAEKILAKSMNDVQRQCCVLLKLLQIQHLDRPSMIKSVHWRALLYWACERLPLSEWTDYNLCVYFVGLLDDMVHNLVREELRDYFMSECNILENTEEDLLHDLTCKIIELRREPLKHMYAFNESYRFSFSPMAETWQEIFKPVHEGINKRVHDSAPHFLSAQIKSSELLMQAFAREKNLPLLQEVASKTATCHASLGLERTSLDILESVAVRMPLDISIYLYEYILKEQPTFYIAMSNLGCMYHAKIFQCVEDDATKKRLAAAADEMFREATSKGVRGAAMVDYGLFLCNMKRVADAVDILEKFVPEEKDEPKSFNGYGENELMTMDENLTNEIHNTKDRHITVVSVCYALYLLVKCHVNLGKREAAVQALKQLREVCGRLSVQHQPMSYTLLAYAFLSLHEFGSAHSTFCKVASLQPGNNLAAENAATCQALKLSVN